MPQYRGAWLFVQLAIRRAASASSVRAVHLTDPDAVTAVRGHKLLATVYDLIPLKEGISRRRAIAWAGYQVYLRSLPRADVLFPISEQTATDLRNLLHVPASALVVARPGIDMVAVPPSTKTPNPPYFLFLGGPNPNKNLGLLLDALAMCRDLPETLRISGRWLPNQVAGLAAGLEARGLAQRVQHLGFVASEELAGLMRDATALVIPSRDEGFGLPVGEGLAAGAVVIHTRIPVLEEVSAGAALTFEPNSAEDLASCLRRVSGDTKLRAELRERGQARASQLTWDEAIAATLATYERILER